MRQIAAGYYSLEISSNTVLKGANYLKGIILQLLITVPKK